MIYTYYNCHPKVKVMDDSGTQLFNIISIDTELKVLNAHSKDLQSMDQPEINPDNPDEYTVHKIPYEDVLIKYEAHQPKLFVVSL